MCVGIGLGIAAGTALGGVAAAGITSALQPSVPSLDSIINPSFTAEFGGLTASQQNQLAALEGIANPNKSQMKQLQQLQTQAGQTGLAQQQLKIQNQLYPQYEQLGIGLTQQGTQALAAQQLALQGQYGGLMSQQALQQKQALNPQYYQGLGNLGNQLEGMVGQGLTPTQTQFFTNQLNAGQAARGLAESPLSAQNTALGLAGLNMQAQQQNTANAQNFLNQYPVTNPVNAWAATGGSQAGSFATQLGGSQLQGMSFPQIAQLQGQLQAAQYQQGMQNASMWGNSLGGLIGAGANMGIGYGMGAFGGGTTTGAAPLSNPYAGGWGASNNMGLPAGMMAT